LDGGIEQKHWNHHDDHAGVEATIVGGRPLSLEQVQQTHLQGLMLSGDEGERDDEVVPEAQEVEQDHRGDGWACYRHHDRQHCAQSARPIQCCGLLVDRRDGAEKRD